MKFTSLDELLLPVKLRMLKVKGLHFFLRSLIVGLGAACLWMALGRFFLISGYRISALTSVAAALVAGGIWLFARRPNTIDAAKVLDDNGLEDRMITAIRYREQTSLIAELQRQDAFEKAVFFIESQLEQVVSLRVPKKTWLAGASLVAALVLLLLLPNPKDTILQQAGKDQAWVQEQKEHVAEIQKQLQAKPSPHPVVKQMTEDLNELERRLGQTPTSAKALDQLEKSLKKMEAGIGELEKQKQRSEQWAESMQRTQALRELGKALGQNSPESIQREAAKLSEQVQKLTPEQKQLLASELERLAASAAAATPEQEQFLREQLQQAASALRSGEDAAAQLSQLQAGLTAASLAAGALPQARELAASGAQPGQAWAPGGRAEQLAAGSGAGTAPTAAGQSGAAGGQGPGGAKAGAGASSSAPGGTSTGTGGSAGGSATGAAGGGAGGTPGGTGAGSRGLVATPRERSGTGGTYADGGPTSGSGGEVSQGGSAPAMDGASRPYEDVYADYAAEASSALNRAELPQHMQNLVRDYFLEIQPQR